MNTTEPTRDSAPDVTNLIAAVYAIYHAVEALEQVCEEMFDCNDARLLEARRDLTRAQDTLARLGR